jgi:hypothetical protein
MDGQPVLTAAAFSFANQPKQKYSMNTSKPYDRGQPGFFTIDNEPRSKTVETARESNAFIYLSVRRPRNETAIKKLDDDYHKTIEHYKAIAQKRKMLLQQK